MKPQGLEYFLGKICTVFTVPTNRDFKSENPQTFPQPVFHYFVGRVVEVNHRGICIEQWNNAKKLRTFFFLDHIVSISEEEILDPSNPKDREIIEEYKKVNEDSAKTVSQTVESVKNQKYIDLEGLQGLVKGSSR
jgi:hypothetical protein